jgi:hypothetical protein
MHKKGEYPHDQLCRFIAYNYEKYYKFNTEHKLVIFFNLAGAGYSNMVKIFKDIFLKYLYNVIFHIGYGFS